jgi:hypothetical protein
MRTYLHLVLLLAISSTAFATLQHQSDIANTQDQDQSQLLQLPVADLQSGSRRLQEDPAEENTFGLNIGLVYTPEVAPVEVEPESESVPAYLIVALLFSLLFVCGAGYHWYLAGQRKEEETIVMHKMSHNYDIEAPGSTHYSDTATHYSGYADESCNMTVMD